LQATSQQLPYELQEEDPDGLLILEEEKTFSGKGSPLKDYDQEMTEVLPSRH
jgi:hypothetical protein